MKAAVFEDGVLIGSHVLENDGLSQITSLLDEYKPERSILSSVIHHSKAIEDLLLENTKLHLLNHQTKLNFSIPVGKPEQMGADRLALAAAAVHFYPGKNNLVVGLGSCITFNFINKFISYYL